MSAKHSLSSSLSISPTSPTQAQPTALPSVVYRVHRSGAQTRYSFATGFAAKNQTTIVNYTSALSRFGLAHLNRQTNISSPFISVYDNARHAENVAAHFAEKFKEDTWVVSIDTKHFARGPVFRAIDILTKDGTELSAEKAWLHYGEYLVMYRIPPQAVRDQTPIARAPAEKWRAPGVIGSS